MDFAGEMMEPPEEILDAWVADENVRAIVDMFQDNTTKGTEEIKLRDMYKMFEVMGMERAEAKMDPLHKKARANWIHLAKTIQHMPPGPTKLKNEKLVMHLARNLALREMAERKTLGKMMTKKKSLEKKLLKAGGKKLLRKAQAKALAHLTGQKKPSHQKEINGIPVGHRKCFERACLRHLPNGKCAAEVITCGHGGKKPAHTSHLSKAEALKKLAKSPMNKMLRSMMKPTKATGKKTRFTGTGRNDVHEAGEQIYAEQVFLFQQMLDDDDKKIAPEMERNGALLKRMRENESIAQEESEHMFEDILQGE